MWTNGLCRLYKHSAVWTRQLSRRILEISSCFGPLHLLHISFSVALRFHPLCLEASKFMSTPRPHADDDQEHNEQQESCTDADHEKRRFRDAKYGGTFR